MLALSDTQWYIKCPVVNLKHCWTASEKEIKNNACINDLDMIYYKSCC